MAASVYKWFNFSLFSLIFFVGGEKSIQETEFLLREVGGPHPIHISVVEISHNAADKTLEISCKIFTDDFEKILSKKYNAKVDLINPPNKAAMDTLVKKYVLSHLSIKADGKPLSFHYLGFENEGEAAYSYLEVGNIAIVKKLEITINIMHDLFDDQMNIIHVIAGGIRKSTKLDYPEKETILSF